MSERAAQLLVAAQHQLAQHYPDWHAHGLRVAGTGTSFLVCRAETAPFGTVALRLPWHRIFSNDNEDGVAARQLLVQEATLAAHCRACQIPTPVVHALHLGNDGFDFLVSTFVAHDGSPPDQRSFGALLRAIHNCPLPTVALVEQTTQPFPATIAARITRRVAAFERLTGDTLGLPLPAALAALLEPRATARALLHMDARPANLFTRASTIIGIADWANALIGDPALELARMDEWVGLDASFLAGYGEAAPYAQLPPGAELIYRLDAALILAILFLSEAPDPAEAPPWVARCRSLAAALRAALA